MFLSPKNDAPRLRRRQHAEDGAVAPIRVLLVERGENADGRRRIDLELAVLLDVAELRRGCIVEHEHDWRLARAAGRSSVQHLADRDRTEAALIHRFQIAPQSVGRPLVQHRSWGRSGGTRTPECDRARSTVDSLSWTRPRMATDVGATATSPDALRARLVSTRGTGKGAGSDCRAEAPEENDPGGHLPGLCREETPRVDRRTTTVIERNRRLYCRARPSYR